MALKFVLSKMILSAFVLLLTGCLLDYEAPEDTEPGQVTLDLEIEASSPFAGTPQSQLRCAVVLLTSNKGDTLVDSITSEGSRLSPEEPIYLFTSLAKEQRLTLRYALAPGRDWSIRVRLYDTRDSVRQADSVLVAKVRAFEDRRLPLRLSSRSAFYAAQLFLPSEARIVNQGAPETRKIFFTRLRLQEGNNVLRDTNSFGAGGTGFLSADTGRLFKAAGLKHFKPGTFGKTAGIALIHEYAKAASKTYTLKAYGYLEGDTLGVTPERLLFQGSHAVNSAQSSETKSLSLEWQSSQSGAVLDPGAHDDVGVHVVLGPIGKVVMNVQMSGAVGI